MKLYHYVHCPFCLRVRMSLGYLKISYESIVVRYDDEQTPVKLTGKKMLPIFEFNEKKIMNESLDIIAQLDTLDVLNLKQYTTLKNKIDPLLLEIGELVHNLCMPYWIWTPEFDDKSRTYFQKKKEIKRGPFKNLIKDKEKYITGLNIILNDFEKDLSPYFQNSTFSIIDIMIASHLWGLYIFPEFQFSPKMNQYLQDVKLKCYFDYHQDFWK